MSVGPILVSLVAVFAGAALGLVGGPTGSWLQPIRTFGLVSVLGLILVLLLPEALSGLGMLAVVAIAVGYAVPTALDRMSNKTSTKDSRLGAELGYWFILAHQLCDGMALATESAMLHGSDHWDALIAMSVHTVPLTTLVVVSYNHWNGPGRALLRALGIAAATLTGVAIMGALPLPTLGTLHAWIAAVVSGMLLHIIASGPFPRITNSRDRTLDFLATAAGVGLVVVGVVGAHNHSDAGAQFSHRLADAFTMMSLT
ncbi:MAG: hypothetical protein AAF658_18305, partial [Myxococcota bacterium]